MNWIPARYLVVLFIAAAIIYATVQKKTSAPEASTGQGVGTMPLSYPLAQTDSYNTTLVENTSYVTPVNRTIMQEVASGAPFSYNPSLNPSATSPVPQTDSVTTPQTPVQPGIKTSATNNSNSFDPYSFIPRGLMSAPKQIAARSPEQQAIFDYGNTAGSYIKSFESMHMGMPQVLRDFFDDRANKAKAERVVSLAGDFEKLGTQLAEINSVPKEAVALNAALAQGYGNVATGLANLTKTQSDKDTVSAIAAYDASADEFIKKYAALVEFFAAYGVKFSSSDAGSVFMFNQTGL